jgi:hypothetical protein
MKFYYIFWVILAMSLAIGFTNSMGFTGTDYMTQPENSAYEMSDVNGTFGNGTPQDDVSLSVTGFFVALGFVKDLAYNSFIVYDALIDIWGVPEALATVLQAIVAISWAVFFVQLISRFPWGGMEG